jgi:phage-related protein
LYNNSIVFRAGIESVILIFKNLFEVVKFVFGSIYSIITTVFSNIYEYLKGVAKLIYAVLTFDVAAIKKGLSETIGAIRSNVSGMLTELTEKSKTLFKSISENQAKAVNNVLQGELKEVNFSVSKESTKKLETAVTNAVTAGVENGLGGTGGTSAVQSGSALMTPKGIAGQPTNAITSDLSQLSIPVAKSLTEMEMNLYDFNERVSEFIQGSLVDTFSGIGDAIGNALATGTNVAQAIGQTLLKSMGSFLSSLGKQMIAFGTTALFFDKTKKSLFTGVGTPAAAAGLIAAGIALSAIGSAIASSASSGGVGGGGGGASQSYSQAGSTSSSSFSAQSGNEVVFRISGNDLLGVLRRAEGNEQRLG